MLLALQAAVAPPLCAAAIAWDAKLYNPKPQPDDVIVPMPCGGAMAFRRVAVPTAEQPRDGFDALAGPFTDADGSRYLLVGKYEVSVQQYEAVRAYALGADCPAGLPDAAVAKGNVSWASANGFGDDFGGWMITKGRDHSGCDGRLQACIPRLGGKPAKVRLPTGPEWEYAARGGLAVSAAGFRSSLYPMGGRIESHAWINTNSRGDVQGIGLLAPNPLGLHDLYGNVSEMMQETAIGDTGYGPGKLFTMRGGSRYSTVGDLGADYAQQDSVYDTLGQKQTSATGFRLVIGAPPGALRSPPDLAAAQPSEPPEPPPPPPPAAFVGHLQINVPVPARVWLDGEAKGEAAPAEPLNLSNLSPGEHRVRVTADGYSEQTQMVELVHGKWTQLKIELEPAPERWEEALALPWAQRLWIQQKLERVGYDSGLLDSTLGIFWSGTRAAIRGFQEDAGLEPSGYLTEATLTALDAWVTAHEEAEREVRQSLATSTADMRAAEPEETERQARQSPATPTVPDTRIAQPEETEPQARHTLRLPFEPEMVQLPGGTYWMGSPEDEPGRGDDEGPRHRVTIRPFAIGKTEVTFAQYDAFADATGRKKPHTMFWGRGAHPVINVDWNDALAYARWLSQKTGKGYRLPSEAEWEYAARGGTETPFWTGSCIHTDQANYGGNVDYDGCGAETGVYRKQTIPAGSLPANPFGLHEVAGNVWEWVQDCWSDSYRGAPDDGSSWESGDCHSRVFRGGSWDGRPRYVRSADRNGDWSGFRYHTVGFRVAQDP